MDIEPPALISSLEASPFQTTFTRQMNTACGLYGPQLLMPRLSAEDIQHILFPVLKYYPQRDRGVIADWVEVCILLRKKFL